MKKNKTIYIQLLIDFSENHKKTQEVTITPTNTQKKKKI